MQPTIGLTWDEKKVLVALALAKNPFDFDAHPAVLAALHRKGMLRKKTFFELSTRGRLVVAS